MSEAALNDDMRRAIEWDCARLIALYANLNDEARWEAVAALYTDDGWMTRPSAPDARIVGRDAILAAFNARPPRATRHVCSNVVIDVVDADTATGTSAMVLFKPSAPPLAGWFHDAFARTPAGWRFASRRGSLSFPP